MIDVVPSSTDKYISSNTNKLFTDHIVKLIVSDLQGIEAVHVAHVIENIVEWKTTHNDNLLVDAKFYIDRLLDTESQSVANTQTATQTAKTLQAEPAYVTEGYLGRV